MWNWTLFVPSNTGKALSASRSETWWLFVSLRILSSSILESAETKFSPLGFLIIICGKICSILFWLWKSFISISELICFETSVVACSSCDFRESKNKFLNTLIDFSYEFLGFSIKFISTDFLDSATVAFSLMFILLFVNVSLKRV